MPILNRFIHLYLTNLNSKIEIQEVDKKNYYLSNVHPEGNVKRLRALGKAGPPAIPIKKKKKSNEYAKYIQTSREFVK